MGSRYVLAAFRILVNSNDPVDVQKGRDLEDAIKVDQPGGPGKFEIPEWDPVSHKKVRDAIMVLADTVPDSNRMFGMPNEVDPIRFLCGTAALWGGNKHEDAIYLNVVPEKNDGNTAHKLTVKDVPVDGFWSVIVYNKDGYIPQNDRKVYSFNNLTAKPDADGSVTIQFGGWRRDRQLYSHRARLELHGPPLSPAQGNPQRHLEVSRSAGGELMVALVVTILSASLIAGCAETARPVQRANPASQNCVQQGGKLAIERGPGGEIGVCLFEDNRQCEEWALLRGLCPAGGIRVTGYATPEERLCAIRGRGVYESR